MIGVGIVGLSATGGWAAGAHLPALAAVDGIELRALTAGSETSARAAGEAYGVDAFASVEELAQRADVDLVVVTVKVPRHRELILPALAAGKPVLSEWPLAVDLPEAEALERAARGTRSFVGLQGRSSPTFRWLHELVADGYVGEVLSATVVASSAGWGPSVSERGRYTLDRSSGATMLSIGFGHAIDVTAMVVGELEDVVATTATRRPRVALEGTGELVPMTAEDQVAVSGTLTGGAILSAHYRGGTVSGPGFALTVDGTEGTLEVTAPSHPNVNPVTVRGSRGSAALAELPLPDGRDHYPQLADTRIHALTHAYAAIRDDLTHGTSVVPDFAHAVRRHRLLDAITRSAATGRRVALAAGASLRGDGQPV
jgi:predicted dehydrogenase